MRRSYTESCQELQKLGYIEEGAIPPMPNRMPQYDDPEPLGVNFFRTQLANDRLENLTLRRTFFGRSEFADVSFKNTDLSESNLCWNDFVGVDFTDADLRAADLRSSTFSRVAFVRTILAKCDLRRSTFADCRFDGADLSGAILHTRQKLDLPLSEAQLRQVAWTQDHGEEPGGG